MQHYSRVELVVVARTVDYADADCTAGDVEHACTSAVTTLDNEGALLVHLAWADLSENSRVELLTFHIFRITHPNVPGPVNQFRNQNHRAGDPIPLRPTSITMLAILISFDGA